MNKNFNFSKDNKDKCLNLIYLIKQKSLIL